MLSFVSSSRSKVNIKMLRQGGQMSHKEIVLLIRKRLWHCVEIGGTVLGLTVKRHSNWAEISELPKNCTCRNAGWIPQLHENDKVWRENMRQCWYLKNLGLVQFKEWLFRTQERCSLSSCETTYLLIQHLQLAQFSQFSPCSSICAS